MKKMFCKLLSILLVLCLCIGLTACGAQSAAGGLGTLTMDDGKSGGIGALGEPGGADEPSEPGEPTVPQKPAPNDGYAAFSSTKQDFSFLYDEGYTAKWSDENGATVYTEHEDSIPYILVFCNHRGDTNGFDISNFFYFKIEEIKEQYGSRLKSVSEVLTLSVGDKKVPGVLFTYTVDTYTVEMFLLLDDTGDSLMQYTAKYVQGEGEPTMQALVRAMTTMKLDADYYANSGTSTQPGPTTPDVPALNLVKYDGKFFSVMLPKNWKIETMGQYNTFGFRAWDPANPDYQIFYYGKLNPFMKSEAARKWNAGWAHVGFPYNVCADTIVVEPGDVSMLFNGWNKFAENVAKYTGTAYEPGFSFAPLNSFKKMDIIPISTYFSSIASAEAIVLGSFRSEQDTECYAKLCASLVPGKPEYQDGIDLSFMEAYSVSGVLAPAGSFLGVEQILSEAIYSLDFTQAYVKEADEYTKKSGEDAMASNAALQATYEKYNEAWHSYISGKDLS